MTNKKNQSGLRIINRANVLRLICEHPYLTRQEISERLGLSKMAVVNIITEYENKGYVQESIVPSFGTRCECVGRPSFRVNVVPNSVLALCLFFSEMEITCSLVNFRCEVLASRSITPSTKEGNAELFEKADRLMEQVLEAGAEYTHLIRGIGIAAVGLIDSLNGRIIVADNFPHINNMDVVAHYKRKYQLPVFLSNDMDASAIAERHYGRAIDTQNFIYMGVNSCIGLGIYVHDSIYRGYNGFAGELGFTTIDYRGRRSPFGYRGRLESYVRIDNYVKKVNSDIAKGRCCSEFSRHPVQWIDIVHNASEGDQYCQKIIYTIGDYLSIAVANIMNLFDPEKIVIGGLVASAGSMITDYISDQIYGKTIISHFSEFLTPSSRNEPPIVLSAFADRGAVAGAGTLYFDALFQGKVSLL